MLGAEAASIIIHAICYALHCVWLLYVITASIDAFGLLYTRAMKKMSEPPICISQDPTAATLHQQNEAALEAIQAQVQKEQPLTSERMPLSRLEAQYAGSSGENDASSHFRQGLVALQQDYADVRTVRGDGNCFFRAILYALTESMRTLPQEGRRILDCLQNQSWKDVLAAGYDEMALEIFYDAVVDLMQRVPTTDAALLHQEMNQENGTSDYCTWYLRVVTATYLKQDPDRFLPFLLDGAGAETLFLDIHQFCARFVEPMGQECEQLQVLALAEALGVRVHIEYLDGRELNGGKLTNHQFGPEDSATIITLLYRPGHYDILYKKE